MKALQVFVASVVLSTPVWAQTVLLKGRIESKSATQAVIRLDSGATVTVPIADLATDGADVGASSRPNPGNAVTTPSSVPTYDVRQQCAEQWPSNFQMRAFCEQQQQEALGHLQKRTMASADRQTIRSECVKQWPTNYQMRNFCEERQITALGDLGRER